MSDLRTIWQNLETEKTPVSTEQIQLRAIDSLRKSRRDLVARLAFAIAASAFCVLGIMSARLTSVRVIAALVVAMLLTNAIRNLYLSYAGRSAQLPSSCVEFYRRELERQQAFASLPVWQMFAALFVIGWLVPTAFRRSGPDLMTFLFPTVLLGAAGLVVLMAVRKFQARRVQHDLEALNQFEEEANPGGDK